MSNIIITDLKKIAFNTAVDKGFDLVDLQMHSNQNPIYIEVLIKHQKAEKDVSINDCVALSHPMNQAIEEANLIDQPFILEISSTGISEILTKERDFETFKGFPVEVTYLDKNKIKKSENGLLHDRSNNQLHINLKGRICRIPRDDVIQVRLSTSSSN